MPDTTRSATPGRLPKPRPFPFAFPFPFPFLLLFLLLAGVLTPGAGAAEAGEPPVPFAAKLELMRNGKLIGESRFSLEVSDGDWVMRSETEGTKGLAKFLGVEESSVSRGGWENGAPRPDAFRQEVKVSFKTIVTTAEFDREAGTVYSVHKDGENSFPITPGLLDPVSVGLAIRAGLAAGEREWRLPMVDEDEIEEQHFRAIGTESVDTPLGCLQAERVDKIRGPQSKRYTQTWYAPELAWVPVKVAHGKTDGDHMESRLTALTIDGEEIIPTGDACPPQ